GGEDSGGCSGVEAVDIATMVEMVPAVGRGDNGMVSVEMKGLTVVAVVDMVAAAVGVSGVGGGVVMEMWRLGCMATVGGESDRSGDGKCFWGSSKNFFGGDDRRRVAGSGGGGRRQRWSAVGGRESNITGMYRDLSPRTSSPK
nr:hypothetical protein [Tanacetum cinerariifolium]